MSKVLGGLNIVVTRPAHQAEPLCELIEENGASALRFPVLEIMPPADNRALCSRLTQLPDYDLAIFISPNAVNYGLKSLSNCGLTQANSSPLPDNLHIAAVGQATVRALQQHGLHVDIVPQQQFNSEALLALPALQVMSGKKVIIWRGEGGRELLADSLRQRGAEVDYAECYRRACPQIDPAPLRQALQKRQVDIIIVTSSEGLQNLVDLLGESVRADLLATPLLLVSERTASLAAQLGFTQAPIIAKKASDQDILQALIECFKDT